MSEFVTIWEVGPRDGLQNEARMIPARDKIALVDQLSACGFRKIEVTSFVSPKWVPQMGDAAEVMDGISRCENVDYAVLTPNMRGFEGAVAAKADEVAIFASASEGFSQHNINCSIEESIERFLPVAQAAKNDGIPLRGYVSCITDCPYDGSIEPEAVQKVTQRLLGIGCYEVSLGDTIGYATPEKTARLLDHLVDHVPFHQLAGHFHDTKSRAIENIDVCLDKGIRVFDASIGGLGGCPYAPGAKGNVATERVVAHLHARGFKTGLDERKLGDVSVFARELRGDE